MRKVLLLCPLYWWGNEAQRGEANPQGHERGGGGASALTLYPWLTQPPQLYFRDSFEALSWHQFSTPFHPFSGICAFSRLRTHPTFPTPPLHHRPPRPHRKPVFQAGGATVLWRTRLPAALSCGWLSPRLLLKPEIGSRALSSSSRLLTQEVPTCLWSHSAPPPPPMTSSTHPSTLPAPSSHLPRQETQTTSHPKSIFKSRNTWEIKSFSGWGRELFFPPASALPKGTIHSGDTCQHSISLGGGEAYTGYSFSSYACLLFVMESAKILPLWKLPLSCVCVWLCVFVFVCVCVCGQGGDLRGTWNWSISGNRFKTDYVLRPKMDACTRSRQACCLSLHPRVERIWHQEWGMNGQGSSVVFYWNVHIGFIQSGGWDCFYHADLLFSSRVTLVLSAVQIQNIYMEENRSQNFLMITHMWGKMSSVICN